MAITFILQFKGLGHDKYDAVMKELGLTATGGDWPDGLLTHVAGKSEDGWVVVDTWQSPEQFGRFQETRLGPAFGKLQLPEPHVTAFPVHLRYPA